MAMLAIKAACEPLRTHAYPNFTTQYSQFGPPLSHPISWIKIDNHTDASILFSLDGVTDHFLLVSNGYLVWDIGSNKALGNGLFLHEGTQIWVKEYGSVTFGEAYISACYGSDF